MRTFSSAETRHVLLHLEAADVDISASDDDAVHGEIEAGDPQQEAQIEVSTFGRELRVTVPKLAPGWFSSPEVRVRLRVPAGLDLTLVSGSGDLVSDVGLGQVDARSGSGDFRLAGTGRARLRTGSGDVTVLSVGGDSDVTSGSGDLRVESCQGDLHLRTASGDISLGRLDGSAEAKLASGDFRLAATTGGVSVTTASGDISVGVVSPLPAWLDLHSNSGEVQIALPASTEPQPGDPYVSVYARTGSGDIRISRA